MRLLDIDAVENVRWDKISPSSSCGCSCCCQSRDPSKPIAKLDHDIRRSLNGGAPRYAILSHKWFSEEVKLEDLHALNRLKEEKTSPKMLSAIKVGMFCRTAKQRGYQYAWMDTCCIDQKNPVELSTAINSMYRWYRDAGACFVYLYDFDSLGYLYVYDNEGREQIQRCTDPTRSVWFKRGWTLQELVAPPNVEFFDRNWVRIGSKRSERPEKWTFEQSSQIGVDDVSRVTGVDKEVLMGRRSVSTMSIANRMSWFRSRSTTVPEDCAYCLLGIFGVNIPLLYGEGAERAFQRLQEEIMKYSDDHSLFAWRNPDGQGSIPAGLLAPSPSCFEHSGAYYHKPVDPQRSLPFSMTNKGVSINLRLMEYGDREIATLDCAGEGNSFLSIWLRNTSEVTKQYTRVNSDRFCTVNQPGVPSTIFVRRPNDI